MTRIVIFAKAPVPGRTKTRLIPALGAEGAAALARTMLADTVREAAAAETGPVELCACPPPDHVDWQGHLPDGRVELTAQGEGDLGARMARAVERVIAAEGPILLIGTDCPGLDRHGLVEAGRQLGKHDVVLYPTLDGGYVLIGLKRFDPSLFEGIAWGGATVTADTIQRIEALGWSLWRGATLRDIDEPADLEAVGLKR
ncbi:TIGR04282 family arsenosugar biosynthesis glycosyltransferase [Allosphingosinicella humi]